jgi:CubicO group peptidase (beta-lactamase class C family)
MKRLKKYLVFTLVALILPSKAIAQLPRGPGGVPMAPDFFLFFPGNFYDHKTEYNFNPRELKRRSALNKNEELVLQQAQKIFEQSSAKTLALVDGDEIVMINMKYPANLTALHDGFSFGKVFASMAIGKLICEDKLKLTDTAGEHVKEFRNTDLSDVTVRDLLRMSSGMRKEPGPDTTVFTSTQRSQIQNGTRSILSVLTESNISSADKRFFGGKVKPGTVFRYMGTDPLVLGVIVSKASGTTYAKYLEESIFIPAGMQGPSVIQQDHFGYGLSEAGIRLKIEDWIRFALWLKESSMKEDCFGAYVREASKTQIKNQSREIGHYYGGFGYMLWTENQFSPQSFWTVGYGGQRIGWNYENNRLLLVFSNLEEPDYMAKINELFRDWSKAGN